MSLDPYFLFLLALGGIVLLVSWAPIGLRRFPISLAILCVGIGYGIFASGLLSFNPDPRTYDTFTERITELVVIISLMGAGLKLDRPLGLKRWAVTWRLLAVAMPLSIGAVTALGIYGLAFSLPMAMLLGAALAPTDPVLASEVQTGPPGSGDEDDVRFGLTSEAGLNDAFAFPFVNLAIVAAAGGLASASAMGEWALYDLTWKTVAGVGMGLVVGKLLGRLLFKAGRSLSGTGDGLVAVAATFIAYAATELVHGYGFLAVFVCAVTIRASERSHGFHEEMHDFAELVERLLMMLVLVLFGGAVASGLLDSLTWADLGIALVILLIVRPIAGYLSLIGSSVARKDRLLLAFLGIRGLGSVYYVAYGLNHGNFGDSERLWAITGLVILGSILIHGVTATPLMKRATA